MIFSGGTLSRGSATLVGNREGIAAAIRQQAELQAQLARAVAANAQLQAQLQGGLQHPALVALQAKVAQLTGQLQQVAGQNAQLQAQLQGALQQLAQAQRDAATAVAQMRALTSGGDSTGLTPRPAPQVDYPSEGTDGPGPQATDADPNAVPDDSTAQAVSDFSWAYASYDED